VIATIPITVGSSANYIYDLAIGPDGKRAYVPGFTTNQIAVIDTDPSSGTYNQQIDTIGPIDTSAPDGGNLGWIAVTGNGKSFLVSATTPTNALLQINVPSKALVAEVLIDGIVAFRGAPDAFAYVLGTGNPGSVYVVASIPFPVDVDIKPGSFPNSISLRNRGTIPVAVLSSSSFDAPTRVNRASLTFGRTGDEVSLAYCKPGAEDVNADGLLDLVCHFTIRLTGFQFGDNQGILKGQTVDGIPIEGANSVRILQ
jgi:hypothetical protein